MNFTTINIARFQSSGARVTRLIVEFVVLFVILLLAPAEKTLGNLIKLVFVHGALMGIAQVFLIISAVLGVWFLARKREGLARWLWAFQLGALTYVLVSFLMSLYLILVAWGGIDLAEPRSQAVVRILILAAAAVSLTFLFQKAKIAAFGGIAVAVYASFEFATAGMIMHPVDPIGTSMSAAVKVSYAGTVLLLFVIGIELVSLLSAGKLMKAVAISAS